VGPKYPILDFDDPKSFNVMAFPEFFEEFQRDKYESMAKASRVFDRVSPEFEDLFGRKHERLETYLAEDSEYLLIGLGSMMGTVRETVDDLRREGHRVGLAKVKCYRPFPVKEVSRLVGNGKKGIGVLDRDVAYGSGGVLFQDVSRSLSNAGPRVPMVNFILGLGGRDISKETIKTCFKKLAEFDGQSFPLPGQEVFWPDENAPLLRAWDLGD
jgi:pyruvate/2-oxoacid:ferredoxin oxidoreductase alpha subunit